MMSCLLVLRMLLRSLTDLSVDERCHCLLGLLLCVSTSVVNGELGGPSMSNVL
jgi:hypothetical protein